MVVQKFWAFRERERETDKKFVVCLSWGGKRDRGTLEPLIKKALKLSELNCKIET